MSKRKKPILPYKTIRKIMNNLNVSTTKNQSILITKLIESFLLHLMEESKGLKKERLLRCIKKKKYYFLDGIENDFFEIIEKERFSRVQSDQVENSIKNNETDLEEQNELNISVTENKTNENLIYEHTVSSFNIDNEININNTPDIQQVLENSSTKNKDTNKPLTDLDFAIDSKKDENIDHKKEELKSHIVENAKKRIKPCLEIEIVDSPTDAIPETETSFYENIYHEKEKINTFNSKEINESVNSTLISDISLKNINVENKENISGDIERDEMKK